MMSQPRSEDGAQSEHLDLAHLIVVDTVLQPPSPIQYQVRQTEEMMMLRSGHVHSV